MHSLRGLPHVIDIRNYGLIGAVEMEPRPGKPGARGYEVFLKCFERGVMVRQTGDTIAMSPPLIIEPKQIERIVETLASVITRNGLRPPRRRLAAAASVLRLEDRIPLFAGLADFPDALEPGRHDKGVARPEFVLLAARPTRCARGLR